MSILFVSTILFTGATNKGANNKSQKRPRGDNAVTSKQSSTFLGFFAPKPSAGDAETDPQGTDLEAGLRVLLLGDELTKRESIKLKHRPFKQKPVTCTKDIIALNLKCYA